MRILIILLFISFNSFGQLPEDAYYGEDNSFKVSDINVKYLSIKIALETMENERREVTMYDGTNLIKGNKSRKLKDSNGKIIRFIDDTQVINFFAQFGYEYYQSSYSGVFGFFVFKREID